MQQHEALLLVWQDVFEMDRQLLARCNWPSQGQKEVRNKSQSNAKIYTIKKIVLNFLLLNVKLPSCFNKTSIAAMSLLMPQHLDS